MENSNFGTKARKRTFAEIDTVLFTRHERGQDVDEKNRKKTISPCDKERASTSSTECKESVSRSIKYKIMMTNLYYFTLSESI